MMRTKWSAGLVAGGILLAACGAVSAPMAPETEGTMKLESTAFAQGGTIPDKYDFDHGNVSPPLSWSGAPDSTASFALLCEDPDGRDWVHWVLFNLPATETGLAEGVPQKARLPNGAQQGLTTADETGYSGPRPPSGVHRYFFRLYALDRRLNLGDNVRRDQLVKAMAGHVLAMGELMGKVKSKR